MGFCDVERIDVPFVFEFADPHAYARALASTGPAFEAIQAVGEESFLATAVQLAQERTRDGLPLRAPIALVGYLARKPTATRPGRREDQPDSANRSESGFLAAPPRTPEAQQLFDDDLQGGGYVTNVSRLWANLPHALHQLSDLLAETTDAGALTYRQRAVLVTTTAASLGDAYCSLAWGKKLADVANPAVAASVIEGETEGLEAEEKALADWARLVVEDPNATTDEDIEALRRAGFQDDQIFAITVFVSLRLAFATVNDALGAVPDRQLSDTVPDAVRAAVSFGRLVARESAE